MSKQITNPPPKRPVDYRTSDQFFRHYGASVAAQVYLCNGVDWLRIVIKGIDPSGFETKIELQAELPLSSQAEYEAIHLKASQRAWDIAQTLKSALEVSQEIAQALKTDRARN